MSRYKFIANQHRLDLPVVLLISVAALFYMAFRCDDSCSKLEENGWQVLRSPASDCLPVFSCEQLHIRLASENTAEKTRISNDQVLAIRRVCHPVSIDLSNTTMSDDQIRLLQGFVRINSLILKNTNITEASIATISKLSNLGGLSLDGCKINPNGLGVLVQLKKLQWLSLDGIPAADRDISWLENARSLRSLYLRNTKITDRFMLTVAKLDSLNELDVSQTAIGDNGILALVDQGRCPRKLLCSQTSVSDDGISKILRQSRIEVIDVRNSRVKGDCFLAMQSATAGLRRVIISHSDNSKAIEKHLATLSPHMEIIVIKDRPMQK